MINTQHSVGAHEIRTGSSARPADQASEPAQLPFYVDVMTRAQKYQLRGMVFAWLLAQVIFWSWWLQEKHVVTPFGMFVNSAILVWTTFLPAWYLFFVARIKRPNTALALPEGRVAMIVTKAPSEPWSVVHRTLSAMLRQDLDRPYDVWLADEDPSFETRAWCARNGVKLSTRKGVAGYNNKTWPGREKCKEGNLRYFYEAMGGYRDYEFVVQLDADHVPTPTYLAEMIRPFVNPRVGYVAAPSICDSNADESWAARARLYAEAPWHGSVQAGYNEGYAPQCIGSHYAVRTSALEQIGGLGPELAEDFSTTLMMNSHGWEGAFAFDAIAHGDGPASVSDCITQEFQWSRSLVKVFLTMWPSHGKPLSLPLKVKLGFCQVWYILFTVHMVIAYLFPIVALTTGTPWVDINIAEFLLLSSLPSAVAFFILEWTRKNGWLRPVDGRVVSWETLLFEFIRWPWMLLGVTQAFVGWATKREFQFKVTPKGVEGPRPLPMRVLAPYLLIVLMEAGTAIAVGDPGEARGYYYLALVAAVTYVIVIASLMGLQLFENLRAFRISWLRLARSLMPVSPAPALASLVVVVAMSLRGEAAMAAFAPESSRMDLSYSGHSAAVLRGAAQEIEVTALARPALSAPVPLPAPFIEMTRNVEVAGVRAVPTRTVVANPTPVVVARPSVQPRDLIPGRVNVGAYDPWLGLIDEPQDIEHWYVRQDDPELLAGALARTRNRRTPLITVEPFPTRGVRMPVLDATVAGKSDEQIRRLARVVRANDPQIVMMRWGHEMDLSGLYPWSANDPELYRTAFRRVVAIFREERVGNVRWVWSPAGDPGAEAFFPGADVVDYVGLTVLGDEEWDWNFGMEPQSFQDILRPRYERMLPFGKPIIVAELGVSGTMDRRAAWLQDAFDSLPAFPELRAVVYFNDRNPANSRVAAQPDWRLSPGQFTAFAAAVESASARKGPAEPAS